LTLRVDVERAADLPLLYAHALTAGDELVVRLREGRLEGSGAPAAVQLGSSTGPLAPLAVTISGPAPDRPAVLEAVSLQFVGRRLVLENVVLHGAQRTAINATVTDGLVLRGSVIAGTRIADPTQETILTVSVAPGADGSVLLEDSWLVDNGGARPLMGLLVRSGSGAGATVRFVRSGLVANGVVHDLLVDGTQRVELEGSALVGREGGRGTLLSAGTELVLRDSLVAPGPGRRLVDPESGAVSVEAERSTAVADEDELARLREGGFEQAPEDVAEAVAAAASFRAAAATSAPAVRAALPL